MKRLIAILLAASLLAACTSEEKARVADGAEKLSAMAAHGVALYCGTAQPNDPGDELLSSVVSSTHKKLSERSSEKGDGDLSKGDFCRGAELGTYLGEIVTQVARARLSHSEEE